MLALVSFAVSLQWASCIGSSAMILHEASCTRTHSDSTNVTTEQATYDQLAGLPHQETNHADVVIKKPVTEDLLAMLSLEILTCSWSPSRCFNGVALDCKLPMNNVTAQVSMALLEMIVPVGCAHQLVNNRMNELPVRKFPSSASETGHVDFGPSWTMLLHLSYGATSFYNASSHIQVLHSPGDAFAWWNTGSTPEHSWVSSAVAEKVVINFGMEAHWSLSGCDGMNLIAAGCPNLGDDIMGIPWMLWIPYVCCLGVVSFVLLIIGHESGVGAWTLAQIPLWLLMMTCCCTKAREIYEQRRYSRAAEDMRQRCEAFPVLPLAHSAE